jgi:hypothetical protein
MRRDDKRLRSWSPLSMQRFMQRTVIAVFLAYAAPLAAQREQLSLRFERFGRADATTLPGDFERDFFDTEQLTLTAAHRSVLGAEGNTILVNGTFYRRSSIRSSRFPGRDPVLHAAYYDLLVLRTLDDRHTLALAVRPGYFGNLHGEISRRLRVEGAAFVDRIVTPRTTLGVGLSYTSNFGRLLPVPVVHVVHRRGRKVLIDGLLPSRLDVWYFPRKGLELGLNTQLSGFQYYVSEDVTIPLSGAVVGSSTNSANPAPGRETAPQLQLANATIGPQLRWNAVGKWYLSAEAGTTIVRRYTFGIGSNEQAVQPTNTAYARLGVQRMF